jgi:hypothetical protein
MALDRTSGYDMLVQISETEINNQLATAFLAGLIIPTTMTVPVNNSGITGTATLNFQTPVADLDRPRPRMGVTIPFVNSQFDITAPVPATIAPLAGTITIVDTIQVINDGSNQIVTMDFNDGAPTVTVVFDAASQTVLAPFLAAAGLTLNQAQNLMAGAVLEELQSGLGRLDLTPAIAVTDDTDATTIFDMDVTTINDASAADRDCLVFGIKMASDSGGNINTATTNFIPAGAQSLVMMSNFWLLARVMRPRVATALGLPLANFDTPLRLNTAVPAPGGQGTLRSLEARVEGNRIRVDGRATDSGTGWSAESNFTFFIDLSLAGGAITVTATAPAVDTDVDLEWWVWLATLGLGALFGGIIGAIIAAIVLAIIEAVAEGLVNDLIAGGIGGSLGAIPAIPLGPIGNGLALSSVILDDLELRCSILRSVTVPVKDHGSHSSLTGFSVDIDQGNVTATTVPASDLVWNPSTGIRTNSLAGLTVTGTGFGSLSVVQVSRMPLAGTSIPLSSIPLTFPPSFPFFPHNEVVFGVRTTDGRYAKVKAWRSIFESGALKLEWITFDTPVPTLDIAARWSVAERGEVTEYITADCQFCRSSEVRWRGIFEAWPKLMAYPIDYQWCLCGQVIKEGDGEVTSSSGKISYSLKGRRLQIEATSLGQDIYCELCVSAIDHRGQELFTCTRLVKSGTDKKCRKCSDKPKYDLGYHPIEQALLTWRPLMAYDVTDEPVTVR